MAKLTLTAANIRFIKKNRLKMSGTDMAARMGVAKISVESMRIVEHGGMRPDELPKLLQDKSE